MVRPSLSCRLVDSHLDADHHFGAKKRADLEELDKIMEVPRQSGIGDRRLLGFAALARKERQDALWRLARSLVPIDEPDSASTQYRWARRRVAEYEGGVDQAEMAGQHDDGYEDTASDSERWSEDSITSHDWS